VEGVTGNRHLYSNFVEFVGMVSVDSASGRSILELGCEGSVEDGAWRFLPLAPDGE